MFKLPENLDNKYKFVTLAALRAEQLQAGALPRVESESTKATVIAQEEIASGVVGEYDPETAVAGVEGDEAAEAASNDEA